MMLNPAAKQALQRAHSTVIDHVGREAGEAFPAWFLARLVAFYSVEPDAPADRVAAFCRAQIHRYVAEAIERERGFGV